MRRKWTCVWTAFVLMAAILAVPAEVRSAVRLWDNDSGDNDWFNGVNWDPNGAPAEFDALSVFTGTRHAASDLIADAVGPDRGRPDDERDTGAYRR